MEWGEEDKDVAFSEKDQENWPSPHQIIAILFKESHFAVKTWK